MERLNSNVGTTNAPLQQRPEVLKAVSMNLPINVLDRVIDYLVLVFILQSLITTKLIGIKSRASIDMLANHWLYGFPVPICDDLSAYESAPLQKSHDNSSVIVEHSTNATSLYALVHIACSAPNVSLIHFYPAFTAKFAAELVILQSESDAVQHEPCRFLSYSDSSRNFVAANSVAAVRQHPHGHKPLLKRNRGILKDGSNLGGELAMIVAALALPFALLLQEYNVSATALGASDYAIGPAQPRHILKSAIRVGEVNHRLLQGLWLLVSAVHAAIIRNRR